MTKLQALIAAVLLVACASGEAAAHRSRAERTAFQRENPCPATGQRRGGCPGYVVDHVQPLCAGGADSPSNMQWQTVEDGRRKDRLERAACRRR